MGSQSGVIHGSDNRCGQQAVKSDESQEGEMRKLFLPTVLWLALFCLVAVSDVRAQGCSFENRAYFDGQTVCQYGSMMKCSGDSWTQTGDVCTEDDESERVRQPGATANPYAVEMPDQPEVPEVEVPPASE
jgi:hypothetical protein